MKKKIRLDILASVFFIVVTGIMNLIGYFKLPNKMNTQFSFTGEAVNTMPKSLYLIGAFAFVLLCSVLLVKMQREQKIKWLIIDILIFTANIVMIVIQL